MNERGSLAISDQFLAELCKGIGSEWPLLGISLMYSQAQMDQLYEAYPRNTSRCIMLMLTSWRDVVSTCDGTNPWKVLKTAFEDVGRFDLALEVTGKATSWSDDNDNCGTEYLEERIGGIKFAGEGTSDMNRIFGQTIQCLSRWSKDKHLITETTAWKTIWKRVSEKKVVTICGNPGDGKTTLAYNILDKFSKEGLSAAIVTSAEIIEQCYSVKDKVVFFVDDAFGNPSVNKQLVENWIRTSHKIASFLETDNFRLVLATRKQVYLSCQLEIEGCECFRDSLVDMTHERYKLTDAEKTAMLVKYCEKTHIAVTDTMMEQTSNSIIWGFPLLCKLYTSSSHLQQIGDFFQKPLSVLIHQLQMLAKLEPKAFCGLILVLLHDGKLSTTVFDVFEQTDQSRNQIAVIKEACQIDNSVPLTSIEDGLQSLIGVYVIERDEFYMFMHDAIFDAVTFVFGEKFPSKLLKMCSAKFLLRRVRCYNGMNEKKGEGADMIVLPKRLTKNLASRFLVDVRKGYLFEVFENPSILDYQVGKQFIEEMRGIPETSKQQIVRRRDNKTGKKFMDFVISHGMVDLAKYMFDECVPLKEDLWLYSCKHNQTGIVDIFIEKGFDINVVSDYCNMSAVHVAAEEGHLDLLKYLLLKGANISIKTRGGIQPINHACRTRRVDCVKFLIKNGADPNTSDRNGQCPVHVAAGNGNLEWLKFLVENSAYPFASDTQNQHPIHMASESENPDVVSYLLNLGADPNQTTSFGRTPLHYACKAGQRANLEHLLLNGAITNYKDHRQRVPLHEACMANKDCADILQLLEKHATKEHPTSYADTHVDIVNEINKLPFEDGHGVKSDNLLDNLQNKLALSETQKELTNELGLVKQKMSEQDQQLSETVPTNSIVERESLSDENEQNITSHGKSFVNVKDGSGMTPLHFACKHMNDKGINRVRMLIEMGADISSVDNTNMQPLSYACDSGSVETSKLLLHHGADVRWRGFNRQQAIHFAVAVNKPELVTLVMHFGSAENSPSLHGMRPIHFASRQNAILTLRQLLKYGVNPDQQDDAQYTPLFYACLHGHVGIVKLLLENGANVEHVDMYGRKAIEMLQLRECDSKIRSMLLHQDEDTV